MGYLLSNKKILRKHFPGVAKLVEANTVDGDIYRKIISRDGSPNVEVHKNERVTALHSLYNPIREASGWLKSVEGKLNDSSHILVIGLGLGYHLQLLLNNYPMKKYYIYEPDIQLLHLALELRDMTSIFNHPSVITLAVGEDDYVMAQLLESISSSVTDNFEEVTVPLYKQMYNETIHKFHSMSKQMILQYRSNIITQYVFEKAWFKNIIYNIDKVLSSKSIVSLEKACSDVPAFIVGSGPSLAEDIEYIRKLTSKVLIIAAGSSVQALLHYGIEPHLIVSMDGGEPNLRVFQNVDTTEIPLLFATAIHHGIVEQNHRWRLFVRVNHEELTPYLLSNTNQEPEPSFISTGSVTGTCIQFAAFLGCKKIFLAGQDLSYPDNQYYSEGVRHIPEGAKKKTIIAADEWIANVSGGKNRTTKNMLVTLRDLELLLSIYTDIEFINTSSKGAVIKNTLFRPMKECQEELCKLTNREKGWFKKLIDEIPAHSQKMLNDVGARLKSELKVLEVLNNKTNKIINLLSELQGLQPSQNEKCRKLLIKLNKQWGQVTGNEGFMAYISFALKTPMSQYMRYVPDIVNEGNEFKKAKLIVEHLGKFIVSISEFIPFAEQCLNEAIKRVDKIANGAENSYA
ncbi:motility associated factor glycosyltransferase family protein [Paenibacillus dendritiformis]|uniref:motility associated factor glycosyltransferase family protein n=1 Tax=Paenibacillus dendritiformis TaxID=130049 RepID=UPI00143CD63B|nr:6-hydroxymethylpterin diphosphokinase MptE-like protein [Paenibacillus dendritiformis]NKI20928.1 motility associated factor glycosyltransferase family protein [Paenibacillus dendritiformis]NRF97835.1 motility associated factor glycosyltransferase family protein [Paenibacillus dendritiformis]